MIDKKMFEMNFDISMSSLYEYLNNPEVKDTFDSLCRLSSCEGDKFEIEERVANTCSAAMRYAYKMSKEIGLNRDEFLAGLENIMSIEDEEYRARHYN